MPRPKHPVSPSTCDSSILSTHIPEPPLRFSETAHSLLDIVKKHQLPRVIVCDKKTSPSRYDLKSNLDISQPLLAYMSRSVRKVSAHSLRFDPEICDFVTVGNGILIPDDYLGWFAVMGAPNGIKRSDQTILHYNKLSFLAMSGCNHFLVGGKDCIRGAMVDRNENGETRTRPCQVFPGTVLRRVGLYRQEMSAKGKQKKKKNQELPHREFLKCYDENEREMFFHTHQTGVFYVISNDKKPVSHQILQMTDILARFQLPLVVKLIYGRVPTTPCGFMQVLLLTDSGISNTLVASTLSCYRNINLEIPLGTSIKFQIAEDTPALKTSKAYIGALSLCKERAVSYIKDMKVVFGTTQLGHSVINRATTSADLRARPAEHNKPESRNDIPVSVQNHQISEESPGVNRVISEQLPERSAKTFSRASFLLLMSERIIENRESFILAERPVTPPSPATKAQNNKIVRQPENTINNVSSNMALVTIYEPPKHDTISSTQSRGQHPVQKKDATAQAELQIQGQTNYPCDNASNSVTSNYYGRYELPAGKHGFNSLPFNTTSSEPRLNGTNVYCSPNDDLVSTITIPSIAGQPVRSPVSARKQTNYLLMNGGLKTPPKPYSHPSRTKNSSTSQTDTGPTAPKPPERRDQAKYSDSSSVSDSNSLTSVSDDGWASSELAMDQKNIYVNIHQLKRIESEPSDDGHQQECDLQFQHQVHSGHYITMQDMTHPQGCSTSIFSGLQSRTNDYIDPVHMAYEQPNVYAQADEQASTASDHGYSTLENGSHRSDSGVCDDGPGYSSCVNINQVAATENCKDQAISGSQSTTNGPQLPPRGHPLKPMTLGQAVLRSVPAPPNGTFSQANKNDLIDELTKAGIKASTKIALAGLQLADITNLLGKEDDFDDALVALLPQVGQIDLKRIAMCLRGLQLSI